MKILLILITLITFLIPISSAYTIEGQIISNGTSEPLQNIYINIQNETIISDITGYFYFITDYPPGEYTLIISNTDIRYQNKEINISLDDNLIIAIYVDLKPTGTITGKVCVFPGCAEIIIEEAAAQIITFFDVSCLRLCSSEIHIYNSNGNLIGKLSEKNDMIEVNSTQITLSINQNTISKLNNNKEMIEYIKMNWIYILSILLAYGLVISFYLLIKKHTKT